MGEGEYSGFGRAIRNSFQRNEKPDDGIVEEAIANLRAEQRVLPGGESQDEDERFLK